MLDDNSIKEKRLIINILNLLKLREKEFPRRGENYYKLTGAINEYTDFLLAKTKKSSNIKIKKSDLEEIYSFLERPIFICGAMKSGTTFLLNLLDSENILALPGDSHYVNNQFNSFKYENLANYWIQRLINPTGQSPFWVLGQNSEVYKYFLIYLKYFFSKFEDKFLAVVASIYCVFKKTKTNVKFVYWVEKTPHNELWAQYLKRRFPRAKFIHILRDPLDNICSLKKLHKYRTKRFKFFRTVFNMKVLYLLAKFNHKKIGKKDYLLLRYEDIILNTANEMKKVCTFLGINFSNNLCKPTVMNKPAVSNTMYKEKRVKGEVYKKRVPYWEKELTDFQKIIVVSLLSDVVSDFNYLKEEKTKRYFVFSIHILLTPLFKIYYILKKLKLKLYAKRLY